MGTKERFLVEGENEALTLPEKREKRKEKREKRKEKREKRKNIWRI